MYAGAKECIDSQYPRYADCSPGDHMACAAALGSPMAKSSMGPVKYVRVPWIKPIGERDCLSCFMRLKDEYLRNGGYRESMAELKELSASDRRAAVLLDFWDAQFLTSEGSLRNPLPLHEGGNLFAASSNRIFRFMQESMDPEMDRAIGVLCTEASGGNREAYGCLSALAGMWSLLLKIWADGLKSHDAGEDMKPSKGAVMLDTLAKNGNAMACMMLAGAGYGGKDAYAGYMDTACSVPYTGACVKYLNHLIETKDMEQLLKIVDLACGGFLENPNLNIEQAISIVYALEIKRSRDRKDLFRIGYSYLGGFGLGLGEVTGNSFGSVVSAMSGDGVLGQVLEETGSRAINTAVEAEGSRDGGKKMLSKKDFITATGAGYKDSDQNYAHLFKIAKRYRRKSPNAMLVYGLFMYYGGNPGPGLKAMHRAKEMGCVYAQDRLDLLPKRSR